MKKFEYKTLKSDSLVSAEQLNELGKGGVADGSIRSPTPPQRRALVRGLPNA